MTSDCEVLRAKILALEDEQQSLKETNEAILLEMESLRKESEDDKNHIEELKDRVANLRLNMKSKEVYIYVIYVRLIVDVSTLTKNRSETEN